MNPQDPLDTYRAAAKHHRAVLDGMRARVRRIESGRMATFLVAAVVGLLHRELPVGSAWSLAVSGVAAAVFLVLVVHHRRLRRVLRRTEVAEGLARLGTFRLWRQWDEIGGELHALGYTDALLKPDLEDLEDHPYAADLDVFGPASLRALLGPTPTPTGVATLRAWLCAPASLAEVERRQRCVRALAPDFDGRERLATEALLVDTVSEQQWRQFLGWLDAEPVFGSALPTWSVAVARLLPPLTLVLFALDVIAGLAVPAWTWVVPLLIQTGFAWRWGSSLGAYLGRATGDAPGLRRYHGLLRAWEEHSVAEDALVELGRRLKGEDGRAASDEIRRLERWLDAADSRSSMLHVVFAIVLLWDVHVTHGLERWRSTTGPRVDEWFRALGELEALAALATLAHDHPDWCWPELREGEPGLDAEALGHPLLSEAVLRTSDVRVDPPGRFLLVTGSNMSGKSTLLRSLGLAAVMAQAGSVVCASRLSLTPLRVFTSMRIQDSLTEGVSLFMAELNRLKRLVDAADAADGAPALLYLIDEVLQGTNSDERRIAARRIVSHLLDANAVGAVTTHDLSLHEHPRLDPAATKVHFREQVRGGDGAAVLTFDYKLRPGLATSRNALKLLEIVGLGDA